MLAPPPRAALSRSGASSPTPQDTTSSPSDAASTVAAAAAAAAATAVLRDRDTRITQLEKELALMEDVFTRELDKLSRSESETSSAWQAKFAALAASFDVAEREKEEAKREVLRRGEEVERLRAQVRGLKEWVSQSTRRDGGADMMTDDEVRGRMERLGNELQNWVVGGFRKGRVVVGTGVGGGVADAEVARLVPMFEEIMSKVHLLQALVSRVLVEEVFGKYFVGLSDEQAGQITQVETLLGSFAASSPEPVNQWRAQTLALLKREAGEKLQAETAHITATIVRKVNALLDAITDTTASEVRNQGLRGLVTSAIELSRLLVVQKAVFKVFMPEILPHQRTMFDSTTMEDQGGEDDEGLEEREICCVAFPGILKRGDESGGHLQYCNVISKARVLCSPE
ncbi:hypothetical protein OQA88_11347 [Cercophora sp. LCS_1]